MKKSVKPMKFFPHESIIAKTVAANSAHFILDFTKINPRKASKNATAPTYTGPDVIGCSPQ